MGFTVPVFNQTCNVFTGNQIAVVRLAAVPCNLAWGRRTALPTVGPDPVGSVYTIGGSMTLLLPPLTDVRDPFNSSGADQVECPAGSGRYYTVLFVDDIGKGFANEHRAAQLQKRGNALGFWPTPVP